MDKPIDWIELDSRLATLLTDTSAIAAAWPTMFAPAHVRSPSDAELERLQRVLDRITEGSRRLSIAISQLRGGPDPDGRKRAA